MDAKRNFTEFVHECTKDGHLPWVVGAWDEKAGQYTHPLSAEERRLNPTGFAWFSRGCSYMPHFPTRQQALRHARHVYGG
jgi:hypothetical protein